jgi:prepilin-type N-terminal cleavage/methylation domain-containing protein
LIPTLLGIRFATSKNKSFWRLTLNPSTHSKGFTLLEVLITLVILSVSLLALAGLMVTTTRNNAFGGSVTEAATFAQDKLEEFRVTAWERLLPTTSGPRTDQKKGSTGTQYGRSWTIEQTGDLKTVAITIQWNDRINHSIRLVSVVCR